MSLPQTVDEFVDKWVAPWGLIPPDERREELKRDLEWLLELQRSVDLNVAVCPPNMTPEERKERQRKNPQPAEVRVNPNAQRELGIGNDTPDGQAKL